MNFTTIQEVINKKLESSGYTEILNDIDGICLTGSVSSEIIMGIGFYYLKTLKNKNPDAYELIENEIQDYIKLCYTNGMRIQ